MLVGCGAAAATRERPALHDGTPRTDLTVGSPGGALRALLPVVGRN